MAWHTTGDADEFLDAAGGFLRALPAEHTILLTVLENLRARGGNAYGSSRPRFGFWRGADGAVAAAYMQTPPHPLVLSDIPEDAVASMPDSLDGVEQVNVADRSAGAVAARLRRGGARMQVRHRMRLYRLGELAWPDPPPPGRARLANPEDSELLRAWYVTFLDEIGDNAGDPVSDIDDRIEYRGLYVWEVDGVPVSMAGRTRPAAGMVRLGPVFTPAEYRRLGYAGAVTAEVSARAREIVGEVLLFTDLDNATSNSLYLRLGYRPVQDRVVLGAG